ncbi:MAG: protein TolB [Desulforhopalus sp.]|nr:protein TolB [Desulforhopalus sp.]
MKNTRFQITLFTLLCLLLLPLQTLAADRVYLDITSNQMRKINVALPTFVDKATGAPSKAGQEMASLLGKALEFHGIIQILDPTTYNDSQQADWKMTGADYVVLGQYTRFGSQETLEIRMLDVASGKSLPFSSKSAIDASNGKSFTGKISQQQEMLFNFCDDAIKALTGIPGIANSRIVFVGLKNNAKEVYLTNILGKDLRQITRHKNITVSPRFVPHSTNLTYSSYHSGNQNLYITNLLQNKTTRALSRRRGMNLAPSWSPDGSRFIVTLSKKGNPDLYLMNSTGEIIRQLTSGQGINVSPTWSPDGKYITFTSDRAGNTPQLYLMNLATGDVRRLTFEGVQNAEADWSPTENLIVFTSLRNGVYQIFTMNPLSSDTPKQLTDGFSYSESPCWSPDGRQIIFSRQNGAKSQIYAIMKDGSFQRRIFNLPGSQTYPRWAR